MADQHFVSFHPSARPRGAAAGLRGYSWAQITRQHPAAIRAMWSTVAAVADVAAILCCAILAGLYYHKAFYQLALDAEEFLRQGAVFATLFVLPNILRREYKVSRYLCFSGHAGRVCGYWNLAFTSAIILTFLTKTTADLSRGAVLIFYIGGLAAVILVRFVLVRILHDQVTVGSVAARRIFLVGYEEDIERFNNSYQPWTLGMRVVSASVLRGEKTLAEDLALASAAARMLRPEDIFILVPWAQKQTIEACVDVFLRVPASIHLGTERVLDRFADFEVDRVGPITSLHVVRRPLSPFEVLQKRLFDIVVASLAMVLLSPLFLLMAILIKLDSAGPVFFLQRRYGFNQEPFRIFKFRSMSTMDDGAVVQQARENDVRITRVGHFMRKFNIDELPQLINVIRGEMSLVGPRPHALAHDQQFEQTVALYARRHNVRPGITGWAQVNGLRGETNTDEKIRKRVEYDLHYIDHWSMLMDIRIMFLTVFSSKAYRNAR